MPNTNADHNIQSWAINHKNGTILDTIAPARHKFDRGDDLESKIKSLAKAMDDDAIVNYLLKTYSKLIFREMQSTEVAGLSSQSGYITTLVKSITNRKR